jgi:hypothetical protein
MTPSIVGQILEVRLVSPAWLLLDRHVSLRTAMRGQSPRDPGDRRGQVKAPKPASFDGAFKSIVGCLCSRRSMRIYLQVRSAHVTEVRGTVVAELPLSIYVNGERLVTLLCSPYPVAALVGGHLSMVRHSQGAEVIVGSTSRRWTDGRTSGSRAPFALCRRVLPPGGASSTLRVTPPWCPRASRSAGPPCHYKESRGIHSAAL